MGADHKNFKERIILMWSKSDVPICGTYPGAAGSQKTDKKGDL
jgi:hypothetical protein